MARSHEIGDFWSRRRAAVRAEAEVEEAARLAAESAAQQEALQSAHDGKSDDEILAELGLPDPETLGHGDDFKAFLQSAVPTHIRRRALRRLWRSNPVLANLDGLVDHGEDFTDAAMVQPGMATVYEVGRGMIRRAVELADAGAETEKVPATPAPYAQQDEDAAPVSASSVQQEEDIESELYQHEAEGDVHDGRAKRRMRFTFET